MALAMNSVVTALYIGGLLEGVVCVCVCVAFVDAMGNQIGDAGAEYIARALERNTTINKINMYGLCCLLCAADCVICGSRGQT